MKYKKILSVVFAIMMLTTVIVIPAYAEDYETAWFPAPALNVSQLAYESYSHGDQNAIDILPGGNVFAPFTGKIVYTDASWGYVVLQSLNKVYYADGTLDYMTVGFMHDSNISDLSVNQVITQGTAFYQAGGMGNGNPSAYGAHVHITVHKGKVTRGYPYGNGDTFAYKALWVNTNKTTSIVNKGVMASGNTMYNNAPSNYANLWVIGAIPPTSSIPGKPVLTGMQSAYTADSTGKATVTFSWAATANTTHYNVYLD